MPDDSTRDATTALTSGGLFKTSGFIALANLIGRLLGFAGDTVKSHYFGAGGVVDAFNVAAAVPMLLNDLLIQSLVNSAYIPVFNDYSAEQLARLSSALINITSLFFATIVLIMELSAPLLASILNGGAPADTQALTVNLLHITIPALFILNFSAIVSGLLYAKQRVVLPAIAALIFNGTIVLAAFLLHGQLGIPALAIGLLLGAVLQVAVQLYGLRGTQLPYHLLFWHPGIRRIAALFSPILAGLLIEVFLSRPLTYALASQTGEGGIAWMGYALTLRQLPEGLIASALSITVLVRLSAVTLDNLSSFRKTLARGLRLAFLLIIPASVGLFLLAHPITALLFEHGNFSSFDTGVVTQALRWYLVGLPFSTIDLLLVVAFYSRRNTLTPALIGLFTTFAYIGLARALLPVMGLYALMAADSIRFLLHTALSILFLFRSVGGLSHLGIYRTLRQSLLAVIVMGVVVGAVMGIISPDEDIVSKLQAVVVPVLIGLLVYLAILVALGVDEISLLRQLLASLRHRQTQ
jgi:putative peptidoglycan lipid II flippase